MPTCNNKFTIYANSAFNVLFRLLPSACTHCHFKFVTSSTVAPTGDIFEAYFQENGHWMPAALLSTDLLHYCIIQNLLATLLCTATDWQEAKAHWKCVSLSKLPGVRRRKYNQDISFPPSSTISSVPALILVYSCSPSASPLSHSKLFTGTWVFWFQ